MPTPTSTERRSASSGPTATASGSATTALRPSGPGTAAQATHSPSEARPTSAWLSWAARVAASGTSTGPSVECASTRASESTSSSESGGSARAFSSALRASSPMKATTKAACWPRADTCTPTGSTGPEASRAAPTATCPRSPRSPSASKGSALSIFGPSASGLNGACPSPAASGGGRSSRAGS